MVVITPPRKRMTTTVPRLVLKICARIRKRVESAGSQLAERFAVERIRVHDLWHFRHHLIRKVLANAIGVFLKLQFGSQPLDLDGL